VDKTKLARWRIATAFGVAVVADAIQFPIAGATSTGLLALPAEAADIIIDLVAMLATMVLLGFHWILLPSFVLEALPFFDLVPTWTAAVAYVAWRRNKEGQPVSSPVVTTPPSTPPQLPPPANPPSN